MAFRDGPLDKIKVPLTWTAGVSIFLCLVFGLYVLLADRQEPEGYRGLRSGFDMVAAPVGGVFAAPVRWFGQGVNYMDDYFMAVSENRRLREEVAALQAERDSIVALRNLNQRYEAMLGIRVEPDVPLVTARSVSEARGPFVNSRLVDVGSTRGVRVGNPVINEHGLVGRVTGTSDGVSRMLLLTDVTSRVPVLVGRTDARAILRGDGFGNPRLDFMRGVENIEVGDLILSSGDGGNLPRGLPVGVAARGIDGSWRVRLFSDRGPIDLVRVMLFEDFSRAVTNEDLAPEPLEGLETAAPPGSLPQDQPVESAPAGAPQ